MNNKAIGALLKEGATLLELTGGNPYRIRALSGAARTIERLDTSALDLLMEGTLTDIKGVGKGTATQIEQIIDRGSFDLRDDLLTEVPPGVRHLLRIKGLGAKRVRQLWKDAEITSLDRLEQAAGAGHLASLDGFGPKLIGRIQEQIPVVRRNMGRSRLADAHEAIAPLLESLRGLEGVEQVVPAGSFRRGLNTVADVDLVVSASSVPTVDTYLEDTLGWTRTEEGTWVGHLESGLAAEAVVTDPSCLGSTLWAWTGSDTFQEAWVEQFGMPDDAATEAEVFSRVDLAVIPPELREGADRLDAAANDALPTLITQEDLRGCLHNHSTYSDGAHTLEDMAEAVRSRGYTYFCICDHSQSLKIAHGLSIEDVRRQQDEIRHLNAQYEEEGIDFRIFSGTESDILRDGSLDYPDDVLASFDVVVASVHVGLEMDEDTATERVLTAIRNPYTTILGHPTGRLLLRREGYPLDMPRIIDACAEHNVALELNAHPARLDLDWEWVQAATAQNVLIAINPDAHSIEGLDVMRWGLIAARKGGLTPEQCLNARSREAFADWLSSRRTVSSS